MDSVEIHCLKPSQLCPAHPEKTRVGIILIMGWSWSEAGVCFCVMDQKIRDLESLMFSDLTFLGWEMVTSLTGHPGREGLNRGTF